MNRTLCLGLQFSKIKYVSEGKVSFSFGIALLSQFKPRKIVIPHSLPIVESLRIELIFFFCSKKEKISLNLRDKLLTCLAEEIVLLTTHQEKEKDKQD